MTRFHAWSALADRRVSCPAGHTWSPGIVLRAGHAEVMCQQCRSPLIVLAFPEVGRKLVLVGSRSEWEALLALRLSPESAALVLITSSQEVAA